MATLLNYRNLKEELSALLRPSPNELHCALKELVKAYGKKVSIRQIHNCHTIVDAFKLLEKVRILSESCLYPILDLCRLLDGPIPIEIIKSRIELVSPNNLQRCICNRKSNFTQQGSSVDNLPQVLSRYDDVYNYLSEELGERWIDVARKLPGMRKRVEEIDLDPFIRRPKDKIIKILEEFENKYEGDILAIILQVLRQCELNRQADRILTSFQYHFS